VGHDAATAPIQQVRFLPLMLVDLLIVLFFKKKKNSFGASQAKPGATLDDLLWK
jgi:hypothetical protein